MLFDSSQSSPPPADTVPTPPPSRSSSENISPTAPLYVFRPNAASSSAKQPQTMMDGGADVRRNRDSSDEMHGDAVVVADPPPPSVKVEDQHRHRIPPAHVKTPVPRVAGLFGGFTVPNSTPVGVGRFPSPVVTRYTQPLFTPAVRTAATTSAATAAFVPSALAADKDKRVVAARHRQQNVASVEAPVTAIEPSHPPRQHRDDAAVEQPPSPLMHHHPTASIAREPPPEARDTTMRDNNHHRPRNDTLPPPSSYEPAAVPTTTVELPRYGASDGASWFNGRAPQSPGTATRLATYRTRGSGASLRPRASAHALPPIASAPSPVMQQYPHHQQARNGVGSGGYAGAAVAPIQAVTAHPYAPRGNGVQPPPPSQYTAAPQPTMMYGSHHPYHQYSAPPPPPPQTAAQYYASLSPEQRADARARLQEKMLILHRRFRYIPMPSQDCSLETLHSLYESYVHHIAASSNAVQFKIVLIILFGALEFGVGYFGVDISGYAEDQIRAMSRYDDVLLELGDMFTQGGGGEWSPQMRLCMIAATQAIIFILARYVEKLTKAPGVGNLVRKALDNVVDNLPSGNDAPTTDSSGLPIAPGTEAEIAEVDGRSRHPTARGGGESASYASRAAPPPPRAPALDIGSIVGGLMSGAGGVDVASLVGSALRMVNPAATAATTTTTSPPKPPPPRNPTVARDEPVATTTAARSTQLVSPPRDRRRRSPVFNQPPDDGE